MNTYTYPKAFKLAGHTIAVKLDKDLMTIEDSYGNYSERTSTINLVAPGAISKSKIEQTFFHELVHAILDELGELDLSKNERFVDSFSTLLHQAISSGEGKLFANKKL